MDLNKLLKPSSIAVVGASEKEGFGGDACRNILSYMKNTERVYFVNPKREEVFNKKCYKSVLDIDDEIDMMIVCTPLKTVIPILYDGAKKGCGGAVIYASGYGEIGTPEGRENEEILIKVAKELDIAVMGPNCAGFVNYVDEVHAFAFISDYRDRKGNIGVVSQSGQLCLSMMDSKGIKFSYNISSGNAKIVQIEDYLEFLVDDEDTKVICAYIEGIKAPEKFIRVIDKAAKMKKPIVVLKAGRSEKGGVLAASHTGSLSGSDAAFDALVKKYGLIRVDDLQELISMGMLLSTLEKYPQNSRYASMNLSGGETGICADVADIYGVNFVDFGHATIDRLNSILPEYATPNNPLDMTASLSYDADLYAEAFKTVMNDPGIDMVLVGYTILEEIADPAIHYMYEGIKKVLLELKELSKPVAIIPFTENTRNLEYQDKFLNLGIPILPPPIYAFKLMRYLSDFIEYEYKDNDMKIVFGESYIGKLEYLSEYESKRELINYGIGIQEEIVAKSKDEATAYYNKYKFPVAMKVESKDILHKSDVGGVKLNIDSIESVSDSYDEIMENVKKYAPNADINGILMAPMLKKGVEMIIGINNDPQFGPMIMVGMGGIFVELFKDISLCKAPVSKNEALKMIKSLKAYKLLKGYRGEEERDVEALCDIIVQLSNYAVDNVNKLKELDINPVFVHKKGEGISVADALVVKYKTVR